MPTGGEPQPAEEIVIFPDWAMLCRIGRTPCHNGLEAARVAADKNKNAAPLDMDGGPSCYVSFTLAAPRKGVSYLDLHWPKEQGSDTRPPYPSPPAYPFVRATDKDLVHFNVSVPQKRTCYLEPPPDLFVYTSGPPPSVQRLPRYDPKERSMSLLINKRTTGILRLAEDRYIVAALNVYPEGPDVVRAELLVYSSDLKEWEIVPKIVSISQGKMSFVHIDNDFHDRVYDPSNHVQLPEKNRGPPEKITVWTLNATFEWELNHVISLQSLWAQPVYPTLDIHQRLPEFPVIDADDPYVLCCILMEKEFRGKGWMIMVDNHACLRSCTPESEALDPKAHNDHFPIIPLLPTIFCKYLERPTGN
ncbi:unnamed protein product [Alopecurus aequalis]